MNNFIQSPCRFNPCVYLKICVLCKPQVLICSFKLLVGGLSINGLYNYMAWVSSIKDKIEFKGMKNIEVTFLLIEDNSIEVAEK
ncbi:hypothetical protein AEQU1_02477 [Aequorivita sp. CIP111184]|nr:hypothetical protein AEQU1_02477 [Aequorivita sp. CIP111184]